MRICCPNCGAEIRSDDKLCPDCGSDCSTAKRLYKSNVGEGKVSISSNLAGIAKDKNGFIKFTFKKVTKIAGQTGRKALEWLSFDRTGKDTTIKRHLVKEQTENGEWEICHDEEIKYPAKHRPKEPQQ